jgi:saccharopine dehydrogenase-like NADP-dependent oxidoreductase
MQGKAALHFLANHAAVTGILAADTDDGRVEEHIRSSGYAGASAHHLDAGNPESLDRLMASGVDVAIDLLPVSFIETVAQSAIASGVHLVNAFFVTPGLARLADDALQHGVSILPEFGLDPGIDLVLMGEAARGWDSIEEVLTYGAGVPEPAAADNPLKYKVSWTLKGVLDSYYRSGDVVENGQVIRIPADRMFSPENVHEVDVDGVGRLEAFPNGDITEYLDRLGLPIAPLRRAGRYSMRWPGHAAFWRQLVELGLLDDDPVLVGNASVDRREYLAAALAHRLRYRPGESDVAIVRVEVAGSTVRGPGRSIFEMVARRDPDSGILAMGRTTGFTAAIGATLLGSGRIQKRGLLSPLTDVPFEEFVSELDRVGIGVRRRS